MMFLLKKLLLLKQLLHDYMQSIRMQILLQSINETGAYDNEIEAQLKAAVEDFKRTAVGKVIRSL